MFTLGKLDFRRGMLHDIHVEVSDEDWDTMHQGPRQYGVREELGCSLQANDQVLIHVLCHKA